MKKNALKAKIAGGAHAAGVVFTEEAPAIVEVAALVGFDFVFIDCEASVLAPQSLTRMLLAAECRGITSLVRVIPGSANETTVLNCGAGGIIVPDLSTAREAEELVARAKYAPLGKRGIAGCRAADFGYGLPTAEYVRMANEETLVIACIESRQAVAHAEEILSVPGLDGVFLGVNDLSLDMGIPGQVKDPRVVEAAVKVAGIAREKGKFAGSIVAGGQRPADILAQGFQLVFSSMPGLFAAGSKAFLAACIRK